MKRARTQDLEVGMSRVASAIELSDLPEYEVEEPSFSDWLDDSGHLSEDHALTLDL